jgi:hypothetical protein
MLMWILVTATACPLAIWGAIDHWSARHKRQAPKRWPPVTVLDRYGFCVTRYSRPRTGRTAKPVRNSGFLEVCTTKEDLCLTRLPVVAKPYRVQVPIDSAVASG